MVGSAVAVVLMLIAPLPSKFAVPVTAPLTSIALAVVSVAALPVVLWLSVPTVAVNVPLAKFVSVTAPLKSPPSVMVGSAVAVVEIVIAALPSKFAVPVTAPVS